MKTKKLLKSIFSLEMLNQKETTYHLKLLTLSGMVYAVLFTLFMLSSFKAQAQSVSISGPSSICLNPTAVAQYNATVTGVAQPTYSWSYATDFGDAQSAGGTLEVFGVEWHTQTCGTGTPTTTTGSGFAWVRVQVAEAAAPGVVVAISDPLFVNISKYWGTYYAPAFIGTPYVVCKTTTTKTVTVNALPADNCNVVSSMYVIPPSGGVATVTYSGISGTNVNYNVQHNGTSGSYTLIYLVTSGSCSSVSTTTTLDVLDTPAPINLGVSPSSPICFNSGDYTFTSSIAPYITSWSWIHNSIPVVGANSNVWTYSSPAVGTHSVVVTAQHLCGTLYAGQTVIVNPPPPLTTVSVTNPAIYDENVTLTAGTTPISGASYAFTVVTNSLVTPTFTMTPAVSVNTSSFTAFAIGAHAYIATITSTLGCVNTKTGTFTVNGPIYAKFNDPSYSITGAVVTNDFNGDILHYVPDVPVKPALGFSFWKYNNTPYTPTGLNDNLSQGNIGDYYRLSKWNGTSWVFVTSHTSVYNGTNSVSLGNLELETDTYYKLDFENIFCQTADGGGTLKRVLFKTNGVFNENNVDAYQIYNYTSPSGAYDAPHVIFKTTSLPVVNPTGVTGICDDYTITFVNPVKYRIDGAISTTANLNHKFFLQQADASTGPWVEVPFKATPGDFKKIDGTPLPSGSSNDGTYGPTKISFQQTTNAGTVINFLNNKFYRVVMWALNEGYGFMDMKLSAGVVTPVYVLADATIIDVTTIQGEDYTYGINFSRQGGFGWEWNTQTGAAYVLQIFNNPTGVSPVYPVSAGNLFNQIVATGLTGVGTITNTIATVNINTSSSTFTLAATAREGYTFRGWEKGGNLIAGSVNTPTYIFDPAQGVTCGAATSTFAAKYELNNYIVNYVQDVAKATFVTDPPTLKVAPAIGTLSHGSTFSITSTPKPGYQVTGFTDNFGAITGGLVTKTFASNMFVGTGAAIYQRRLTGTPYNTTQVYTVTPAYTEFNPFIYAVAVASPTMTAGVASVAITSEFQILQSGIYTTPFTGATPANAFSWSQINSGAKVFVTAGIAYDCQLEFKYWMRGTPNTPDPSWTIVSTGGGIVVNGNVLEITNATLNHAYRAVYGKKTVNLVALTETPDMGTIVVEYYNPGGVKVESINNVPAVSLIVGSTVTLTVYPKPDYYTYAWKDNDGTFNTNVLFYDRMPGYGYSRWTYTVSSCNPTTSIKPDIDLVRNSFVANVRADGNDYIGGTFTLASSDPAYDETEWKYATTSPGVPLWTIGSGTGFKFNKTTSLKQTQTGSGVALYNPFTGIATNTYTQSNFEKGTSFTLTASENVNYNFVGWERMVGSSWVTVPGDNPVLTGVSDGPEQYRALFTLDVPTRQLNVDSYLPGAVQINEDLSILAASVAGYSPALFVGSSIDEIIKVPQMVGLTTNTVTINAPMNVEDGYVFDYWVVNGTTVTTTTVTRPMTEAGLTVKAVFKQQAYTLSVQSRGYRYATGATSPDQFQIVNHGGTVSGPATAIGGQTVTFNATVNPGWEFINWMIGSVGPGEILTGYQLGQAGVPSLTISMPYLPSGQTTATIYAIYREIGSSIPFPKYTLVTNSDPAGFATTGFDGTYVHSVIVPIFADDNSNSAGYTFSHWEQRSAAGVLYNSNYTSGTVTFNNTGVTGYIMTAGFAPVTYHLNAHNVYPTFGTVQVGTMTSTTLASAPYDILDPPVYVNAVANANAAHYNYQFSGWKYANGSNVVDVLGNPLAAEFYFMPVVPANNSTVDIYAHYSIAPINSFVTLNNKVSGFEVAGAGKVYIDNVEKTPGVAYSFGPQTDIVVKAEANAGYVFNRWEKAGVTLITLPQFNYTVNESVVFDAVYELNSFPFITSVNNPALGTLSAVLPNYTFMAPVAITATPGTGNKFDSWTASGITIVNVASPTQTFNMPAGTVTMIANFSKIDYNVTASAPVGGTVNPTTQVKNYNDPVTVTATANTGYIFTGWESMDITIADASANPLIFSMPAKNVNINANFIETCAPGWLVNNVYENNMQLIGILRLDGVLATNPNHWIGAFVGDECRGVARPISEAGGKFFLTIGSNQQSGETIDLRIWDSESCSSCYAAQYFSFTNLGELGSLQQPFELSCGSRLEIDFPEGFTWFSTNIQQQTMEPNHVLSDLSPCYNDRLIGQTSFALFTGEQWMGSLQQLTHNQMYKLKLCEAEKNRFRGVAATVLPVTLNSGFSWLGYPLQSCISIQDALIGLSPAPSYNDRLIGQGAFAVYTGTAWIGSLDQLCPGDGFVIKLSQSSILQYPESNDHFVSPIEEKIRTLNGQPQKQDQQHTMMLIAKLVLPEGFNHHADDIVYAFIDEELRGSGVPEEDVSDLFFISVGENSEETKQITFKWWSGDKQELFPFNESLSFEPLAAIGELNNPFILTLGEMVGVDEMSDGIWIGEPYPNPMSIETFLPVRSSEKFTMQMLIYNSLGQVISELPKESYDQGHHQIQITRNGLLPGVYIVKTTMVASGQNWFKNIRLIVK